MGKNLIRLLRADEIECRVSVINAKGLSLLLYKDARVDQRILDESFGVFGWKRSHQCIGGNLYCTVEVLDKQSGEWIAKQDVGTIGNYEKEKAQASDSFKRACFNWGIGRELYSAPFIWVAGSKTFIQAKEGKFCCNDRFSVKSIAYNGEREIDSLVIVNGKGEAVYELNPAGISGHTCGVSAEQISAFKAELERTGVPMKAVQDRYSFRQPESMSGELYQKVMNALARTKSVNAA